MIAEASGKKCEEVQFSGSRGGFGTLNRFSHESIITDPYSDFGAHA